jgi:hypothetical protein
MNEHIASKRCADTSHPFRQLLETLNVPVPEVIMTASCERSIVTGTLNSCYVGLSENGFLDGYLPRLVAGQVSQNIGTRPLSAPISLANSLAVNTVRQWSWPGSANCPLDQ